MRSQVSVVIKFTQIYVTFPTGSYSNDLECQTPQQSQWSSHENHRYTACEMRRCAPTYRSWYSRNLQIVANQSLKVLKKKESWRGRLDSPELVEICRNNIEITWNNCSILTSPAHSKPWTRLLQRNIQMLSRKCNSFQGQWPVTWLFLRFLVETLNHVKTRLPCKNLSELEIV